MEELGFQQLEAEGFEIDEDQAEYIPTSAATEVHQVKRDDFDCTILDPPFGSLEYV